MKNFNSKGKITKIILVTSTVCCGLWVANIVALSVPIIATVGWSMVWTVLSSTTSIAWIKMIAMLLFTATLTDFFETGRDTAKMLPEVVKEANESMLQVISRIDEIKAAKEGAV